MIEEKEDEDTTTVPDDARIPILEHPKAMKDAASDSQDVNSNTTNGSFTDALSDCFELEGHQHKKMVANLLNSVGLHPIRLQSQTGDTLTAFATRKSLERDIADDLKEKTWKITKASDNAEPASKCSHVIEFEASDVSNQVDHQYHSFLANDSFSEISQDNIDILNSSWRQRPYIAQAQGELLCGAILVNEKQALLINCAETYSRLPSVDAHREHYSGDPRKHSLPLPRGRYSKIRVCKLDNKLIIGTSSITILATSSLRIDDFRHEPEIGPYTTNFHPSKYTSIFISKLSMEKANKIIAAKEFVIPIDWDIMTNLKQIQSKFHHTSTYVPTRFHYMLTENIGSQPYSVFTFADADTIAESDPIIGSRILQLVALAVITNEPLEKSNIAKLIVNKSETTVIKAARNIISLAGTGDHIDIIGNKKLDHHLRTVANVITVNGIPNETKHVIQNISDIFKSSYGH